MKMKMTRAARKLFLAAVLLVTAAFLPRAAQSLTCCQDCFNRQTSCYNGCTTNPCIAQCDANYMSCIKHCHPTCPV